MPQEPVNQDPVPQGPPSDQDIAQARTAVAMMKQMPPGPDMSMGPMQEEYLNTIQHPQLRAMVGEYAQRSLHWNAYTDILRDTAGEGVSETLHDFLSGPVPAVGGAMQDASKGFADFADFSYNFLARQVSPNRVDTSPFRDRLTETAEFVRPPWVEPGQMREMYGYDGNAQDYYKEALAKSLVEAARTKAEADSDPRLELFKSLPEEEQVALAMDQIYSQLDDEAKRMGFFDHTEYAAKVSGPQLMVWLMTEGRVAGAVGGTVKRGLAGSKFGARMAQAAPRMAKVFGFGAGAFSAGAVAGGFDALDPLTPYEKDLVFRSENPEATKDAILTNRIVHMTVAWPIYEIIGKAGHHVTKALNAKSGEAFLHHKIPLWQRVSNGMAGGATTGTGFAMLPIFEQVTNADDREAMAGFIKQAYAGELDIQELEAWAGQSFGGSVVPFAIMSGLMNMRAMPGMSGESQKMVDTIAREVIRKAPTELREMLLSEYTHSLSTAERMFKSLLEQDIANDINGILKNGKSGVVGPEMEAQIAQWIQFHRPGLSKAEAEYHAKSALRQTGEKTEGETRLEEYIADGEPLADRVIKEVKAGNVSMKDWSKGDIGTLLQGAYGKMLLRRIMAQKIAFEQSGEQPGGRVAEQGAQGEGVGSPRPALPEGAAPEPAPSAQGQLGPVAPQGQLRARNPRMPRPDQMQLPPEAAPSDPHGPKWPAKLRPGPKMVRITKQLRAWSEAVKDIPEATKRVENYVENREARYDTMAAVGRIIGDSAPKVVEQWDNIVEAPEWDSAASNVVAYFGRIVESEKGRMSSKQVSRAIMQQIQEFAADPSQPVGSTKMVNEAQILRRVVGALSETPGGMRTAEWMVSKNVEYLTNLFAKESADIPSVKQAWAQGRKQFEVYVPSKKKSRGRRSPADLQAARQSENQVVRTVAKGALQSIVDHAERKAAAKSPEPVEAPAPQQAQQPGAAPQGEAIEKPAATESPSKPESSEELERGPEKPVVEEPSDAERIVSDLGGEEGPGYEKVGGALVVRTQLFGMEDPIYSGSIMLDSILRHPDLQPRAHQGERRVDEKRVANYVANFRPGAVNPGKFAWLEKDGKEGWFLLDGHHTSAMLEDIGQDSMLGVFLKGLTWEEAVDIAHAQNTKREDLTTIETAKAVARMEESGRFGDLEEIGSEWNRNAAWAQSMVDIANLPESVHQWASSGNLGEGQDTVRKTLAKLGEAKRMHPEAMNDLAIERVAKKITQHKWYNSQRKISDFLDVYQKVTTAEQERADTSDNSGFLFDDYAPTREAMDIIGEITEARAKARSAATEVKKATAKLGEWTADASTSERASLEGAAKVAKRQKSIAEQRLAYLDVVKDRVLQGTMNIEEATDAAKVSDAKAIQSFLEDITKPNSVEVTEEKGNVSSPSMGDEVRAAAGSYGAGSVPQRTGKDNARGDAGSKSSGSGRSGGDAAAETGKPAGESVRAIEGKPGQELGFKEWKQGGAEKVFSSRAAAIRKAQALASESPNADYVVYPENPEKPTGRSRIGWRERAKKAASDFMDRVKDRPDFKEAMKRLRGEGEDPNVTNLYSGLSLERLEAAIDLGKIFLEVGLQSAHQWGKAMVEKSPKVVHPYLRQIWNAMIADPAWEHLPSWTQADSKAVGVQVRKPKASKEVQREYREAFGIRENLREDKPAERLTIDDQVESVRKEDMERARGIRGEDQSFLMDPFLADLPAPTQKVEHPVRGLLRDHQKYLADTFVSALTDGGKNAVLDSSGTGTGKTWTAMATALEMQRRNGGKVVLVTSNNAAIESWRINDFEGMQLDPARVGYLKDAGNPEKDVILASYYNFQNRKGKVAENSFDKLRELDAMIESGEVGAIIWDEAHRAANWIKGTTESQRVVERMDRAGEVGVKQIFATASPFDDPSGMRWMQSLGIWGNDFRGFLDSLGYKTTSKGEDGGFSVKSPPKEQMPYVHMKLIRVRQALAEQGQQVGWDLSAEGVENVFMKLNYSREQEDRYWSVAESYEFLRDTLTDAGMPQLATMTGAWRVNHAKRMIEDISVENAIDFATSAFDRGGRFLFLSSYKSAKKTGSIENILKKPRGRDNKSALDRISESNAPGVAERILADARRHDQEMGEQPPVLERIDKALRERGMRGLKVSGDIKPSERVKVLEEWKDQDKDLDFLVGTRATLGESISAQDTYGRQIFQFVASIPWTGREVVQELGRAHRLNEVTKPVVAWAVADAFPTSSAIVQKVAARLHHLRAGVQGMRSDPTNLKNAKDTAAFFLSAKESERLAMSEVIELESEILRARRAGKAAPKPQPMGVDLTENAEFFGETTSALERKDPVSKDVEVGRSEAHDYGSFEKWKQVAAEKVEEVFEELEPEGVTSDSPMPLSLEDFVGRSAAARDLGGMLRSRDIRGVEGEAREHLDGLLGGRLTVSESGEGEGLKMPKGAKGSEAGAADLNILSAPFKLGKFLTHAALKTFAADPLYYERNEYPPHLRLASNRLHRGLERWLDDPINMFGYRIVEPFLEANRDWSADMESTAPAYEAVRKAALRDQGYDFWKGEGRFVPWALSGEKYDAAIGPESGRLGRIEEYQRGAREWTDELRQRAAEEGFATAEEWLEAQPSYKDMMTSGEVRGTTRDYYQFGRDLLDRIWVQHLSNNREFQGLLGKKEKAFAEMSRIDREGGEGFDVAAKAYAEATAEIEGYFEDKGVEDYFTHYWPDRKNRRMLPTWFKKVAGKSVYNEFAEKGRVSWETGWLEDPEVVLWTYATGMLRKVYMDRAQNAVEATVEGEWKPISGKSLLPLKQEGPEYTTGGKLIESLTKREQRKAEPMKLGHRRVRYQGKAYDAFPGEKRGDMRGLVLREPQAEGTPEDAPKPNELFFSPEEAASLYLEARVGGIRQFGDSTEVMQHMDAWLNRLMGGREYTKLDKAVDAHTNFFYRTTLGFLNIPIAQTNLIGGQVMNMFRLGPVALTRGLASFLSPDQGGVDLRNALAHSGIFTKAQLAYQMELVAEYRRVRETKAGQALETVRLGAAKLGRNLDMVHMAPFMMTETFNRMSAFAAGYTAAKRAGMGETEARREALRSVGSTQFWYEGPNQPMISWGSGGRALMQFNSYGLKFMNTFKLDVGKGWRGLKDSMAGDTARPGDVKSASNVFRFGMYAFLAKQAWDVASQYIMNTFFGDDEEENEGLDSSYLFGTKVREVWGMDDWWVKAANGIKEKTGGAIDITNLFVPGVMLPFGPSMPVKAGGALLEGGFDSVAGDPKAMERMAHKMQSLYIPTQIRKFLQMQDLGGENSDLDKAVEEFQNRLRGVEFAGMQPFDAVPGYKDYRKLDRFYDVQRPFLMEDAAGNEWYSASGPMTLARFFLMGSDPRTTREMEFNEEMRADRDLREARKEYLRDAYKELEIERMEGGLPSEAYEERMSELRDYAKDNSLDFNARRRRSWSREAKELHLPGAKRIIDTSADKFQAWENLVQAAESGSITWSAWFEAYKDMRRRRDRSFLDWRNTPGNAERLMEAFGSMGEKRDSTMDSPDDARDSE